MSHDSGTRLSRIAAPRRVLVVDDIEDNREIFSSFLEHHGFDVDLAGNGVEALARIEANLPDLVIMDLAMPILDGWEATRRIKSNARTRHLIVVVVTGHVFGDSLLRADELGADAVLTKPCSPSDLLEIVERLVDR